MGNCSSNDMIMSGGDTSAYAELLTPDRLHIINEAFKDKKRGPQIAQVPFTNNILAVERGFLKSLNELRIRKVFKLPIDASEIDLAKKSIYLWHAEQMNNTLKRALVCINNRQSIDFLQYLGSFHAQQYAFEVALFDILKGCLEEAFEEIMGVNYFNYDVQEAWIAFFDVILVELKAGITRGESGDITFVRDRSYMFKGFQGK